MTDHGFRRGRALLRACALAALLALAGVPLPTRAAPPDCLSVDLAQSSLAAGSYRHIGTLRVPRGTPAAESWEWAMLFADGRGAGVMMMVAGTCASAPISLPLPAWQKAVSTLLGVPA